MTSKHTPGPWAVHFENRWPWGINIAPNVLQMTRVAYSTRQTSLDDVRDAVGFDQDERADVIRAVAEQETNARLIAMAPRMYEALKAAEIALDDLGACPDPECSDPQCAHALPIIRAILNELETNQ